MAVEDVVAAVVDWKSRIGNVSLYTDYYAGRHRVGQYATEAFRRDFLWVLQNSRENLCKAVVRGFSSKMVINGWEGPGSVAATALVDDLGLTKVFNLTHRETYRTGDSYVLVWPDVDGVNRAWPKLSSQMAVRPTVGQPGQLDWAAMLWVDPAGFGRVNIYYPDALERWTTKGKVRERSMRSTDPVTWPDKASAYDLYSADGDPDTIAHDFGQVPVTWFPHDADELGEHGRSVLEDVVPLQDALNKSVADLIVGGENFAQPLRALMNYRAKRTINPDTGEVTEDSIRADPTVNKLLAIPGDGPLVQLDPPDATKLLAVHEAYAIKIGRVVGLPAFYVSQVTGEPPTGVALRVLSTRLTNLSKESMTDFSPEWSRTMELLGVPDVTPRWEDPAPTDESEKLDNAEARKMLGYGLRENLAAMGLDPDDVERIIADAQSNQPSGGSLAARAFEAGVDPAELVT